MPTSAQTEQTMSHPIKRAYWWIFFLLIIAFVLHELHSSYSQWQKKVKAQQSVEEAASLKTAEQKGETPLQWAAEHEKEQSIQFRSQTHRPEKPQYVKATKAEGFEGLEEPEEFLQTITSPEEHDEQTPVSIEPGQFIRDYYTAVSNQQYDKTWLMLSDHFKDQFHCCRPDGSYQFSSYLKWWNSIQKVKTLSVKVKTSNEHSTIVRARLRYYFKKQGRIVDDAHTFELVTDTENGWLIDEQY